jgi:hypothetical protein
MFYNKIALIFLVITMPVLYGSLALEKTKTKKEEPNFFGMRYSKTTGLVQCLPPETIMHVEYYLDFKDMINWFCAEKRGVVSPLHLHPYIKREAERHALKDFRTIQYHTTDEQSPYRKYCKVLENINEVLNKENDVLLQEYYACLYKITFKGLLCDYYVPPYSCSRFPDKKTIVGKNRKIIKKGNNAIRIKEQGVQEYNNFKVKTLRIKNAQSGQHEEMAKDVKYVFCKGLKDLVVDFLTNPNEFIEGHFDFFCMKFIFDEFCDLLKEGDLDKKIKRYSYKPVKHYLDLFSKVIDKNKQFLAHYLIENGDERLNQIQYLIANCHIDPNILSGNNETLLHVAAKHGRIKIFNYLITQDVFLNPRDENGSTPLHLACEHNNHAYEIIEELLKSGANPNIKDDYGRTPLHYAASNNFSMIVELLLQYGAVVNGVDRSGRTPFDYASRFNHDLCVQILEKSGGRKSKEKGGKRKNIRSVM